MRSVLGAFIVVLVSALPATALPFTPDSYTLSYTATFTSTGTNTACWHCDDADPANDIHLSFGFGGATSGPWPMTVIGVGSGGSVDVAGPGTDITGMGEALHVDVVLTGWDDNTAEYPLPSRWWGSLSGGLGAYSEYGLDFFVLGCCGGDVGPIAYKQAFLPTPILATIPQQLDIHMETFWFGSGNYQPFDVNAEPVPEPATLLLLGTGLLGLYRKRR